MWKYTSNGLVGIEEAANARELIFGQSKQDDHQEQHIGNDSNQASTRHITLRIMHLFGGTALHFKTDPLKDEHRKDRAHHQSPVIRKQVSSTEMNPFGVTASNKNDAQHDKNRQQAQFDI